MISEKLKRKNDSANHWRFALILIGLASITWLFLPIWYSPNGIIELGFLIPWIISMLWIPYTIYRAQQHRLRRWEWGLVGGSMFNHIAAFVVFWGYYCCCCCCYGTLF